MSGKNNGGYAFPVLQHTSTGYLVMGSGGMTLRDYFAAKAMSGWLASFAPEESPRADGLATLAYEIADAMLRAREN